MSEHNGLTSREEFCRAYRVYLEKRAEIHESYQSRLKTGRGTYLGVESWSHEDLIWLDSAKKELDALGDKLALDGGVRKGIRDDVISELEALRKKKQNP